MKQFECSFEKEVIKAARSHQWRDGLRSHAATCTICSATIQVASLTHRFSSEHVPHDLPNHRLIWLKAEYSHKQERLSKFDLVALIGMWLVGALGLIGLFYWQFPQMFTGVIDLAGRSLPDIKNVFSNGTPLIAIIGLLVMAWVFTRDSFFAER